MTNFNTEQLLLIKYRCSPLIPLADVSSEYLPPITQAELHRKAKNGEFNFAVVNTGTSKRPAYYVPLVSLAAWIDGHINEANADLHAMKG